MNVDCIEKMISQERERQDSLYGPMGGLPGYTQFERLGVLCEEIGEIARALNDSDPTNLKEELIQSAAVCRAWLETI